MQILESSILLDPEVMPEYAAPIIPQGVPFKETEFYLHVGERTLDQGWILHLSVVLGKYFGLMEAVLPKLLSMRLAFKIVKNSEIHEGFNNGEYGEGNIGRIISLFLTDEMANLHTIEALQKITKDIPGPRIYSAFRVGSNLYVRYGSFVPDNGVNDYGWLFPRFMDKFGKWIKDELKIPPEIPPGVFNPFQPLMTAWPSPVIQNPLKNIYHIENTLSSTLGLVVYSGKIKMENDIEVPCWIKRAKINSLLDRSGNDEADRLIYEYKTLSALEGLLAVPKVIDFWKDENSAYLITDFINGRPLNKVVQDIMGDQSWYELSSTSREEIIYYYSALAELLKEVQSLGYYMRNCSLDEFAVDLNNNICIFDFKCVKPKIKGISYPLEEEFSKLFISILTDIPISRLSQLSESNIQRALLALTHDNNLSSVLHRGISKISDNDSVLYQLQDKSRSKDAPIKYSYKQISDIIQSGINGLASPLQLIDNLWYTRVDNEYDPETYPLFNKHTYINLNNGVGGVLYTLCFAKKCGFDLSPLRVLISRSWEYINGQIETNIDKVQPGLFNGISGIAALYAVSLENSLLDNTDQELHLKLMHKCLLQKNLSNHISNGLAGDGIAIMQFASQIHSPVVKESLERITGHLIRAQQGDGSWAKRYSSRPDQEHFIGFGSGAAGIVYFLLEFWKRHVYEQALPVALKGLGFITNLVERMGNDLSWPISNVDKQKSFGFQTGSAGIALAYLKSYEYTGETDHLAIAESALRSVPLHIVKSDLTLMDGLTGLGEVYLEALRITGSSEWRDRAEWIVQWICSIYIRESKDRIYWLPSSPSFPFGTLMQGNCGILHFLIRFLNPNLVALPLMLPPN